MRCSVEEWTWRKWYPGVKTKDDMFWPLNADGKKVAVVIDGF
jgi:hypothetical protein